MEMYQNKAFTFIELLVTITTVLVLSGIALATFNEYKISAYQTTALMACKTAQTAIEAGRIETDDATLFGDNRSVQISPNGTYSCAAGCSEITQQSLIPNYAHTSGINVQISLIKDTTIYTIQCGSCNALTEDNSQYNGWLITNIGQPTKTTFSVGSEAGECGVSAPVSTPTATSTPSSCYCACGCSNDVGCGFTQDCGEAADCASFCETNYPCPDGTGQVFTSVGEFCSHTCVALFSGEFEKCGY